MNPQRLDLGHEFAGRVNVGRVRPPACAREYRPDDRRALSVAGRLDGDGEPLLLYAVDDDFGPFFLKFCSYFPYNAKLCINGTST